MPAKPDNIKSGTCPIEISLYYGYVVTMAARYYRTLSARLRGYIEVCDLVQDGCVGLLEAASRFDPSRGCGFLTFAHYRIMGEMVRAKDLAARLPEFLEDQADWRDGVQPASVLSVLADPGPSPADVVAADCLAEDLRAALAALPADEHALLRERFFEKRTLQEVADRLGLALATVFGKQRKALVKLRKALLRKGYSVADLPNSPDARWPVSSFRKPEKVSSHERTH